MTTDNNTCHRIKKFCWRSNPKSPGLLFWVFYTLEEQSLQQTWMTACSLQLPCGPTPVHTHTHTHTHRTNKPHCCRHFTQTHLCLCFLNTSDFLESWHVEILNFFGWTWQALLNKQMWPWTTKPVSSRWGIFVAIAKSTLYGSKL